MKTKTKLEILLSVDSRERVNTILSGGLTTIIKLRDKNGVKPMNQIRHTRSVNIMAIMPDCLSGYKGSIPLQTATTRKLSLDNAPR